MAARPFRPAGSLPEPLTVEEIIEKFDVSPTVVRAARQVLTKRESRRTTAKKSKMSAGRLTDKGRSRKASVHSKGRIG